jgi:hypothetical protein
LQGVKIKATVVKNGETGESEFKGEVTVHKIELSTKSTYVDNNTVVFNINGLPAIGDLFMEYYAIKLGTTPSSDMLRDRADLTGNTSTELKLLESGAYQILARITNEARSYYSNWVQANVVCYDSSENKPLMVIIGGIPDTISNCETSNLYQIISVPGLGGSAEIVSYLTDEPGNFNKSDWS